MGADQSSCVPAVAAGPTLTLSSPTGPVNPAQIGPNTGTINNQNLFTQMSANEVCFSNLKSVTGSESILVSQITPITVDRAVSCSVNVDQKW